MDEHQWHVGYAITSCAKDELYKYTKAIENAESFADLFRITEIVRGKVDNVGDLWSYDTALRIGFKLRIYPNVVYLQRGARVGARKLLGKKKIIGRYLSKDIFIERIPELNELECYEIEHFLCDFKDRLNYK